jgi:hypothetical protein
VPEESTFIVRVRVEPGDDAHASQWRGSIEHVQSRQKAWFRGLDRIAPFIQPYVDALVDDSGTARPAPGEP